jgi:hypothetical protein
MPRVSSGKRLRSASRGNNSPLRSRAGESPHQSSPRYVDSTVSRMYESAPRYVNTTESRHVVHEPMHYMPSAHRHPMFMSPKKPRTVVS